MSKALDLNVSVGDIYLMRYQQDIYAALLL